MWGAWGWVVSGMDRTVSWRDFPADPTAENYLRIVLDPNMIGMANRVTDSILIATTALVTAAAVQRARSLLRRRIVSERKRAEVTEVFGRFVLAEVAETLSQTDSVLPHMRRTASAMFVDVKGFTILSEMIGPEHITALLDDFFEDVGQIAAAHKGVCISLIGDAALIAFNAPLDNPDHARAAVTAGMALLDRVRAQTYQGRSLSIRIGVATGAVAAETVGGRGRRSYPLYGDTVNLAQRLEALNKDLESDLLVDEATWCGAVEPAELIPVGEMNVRGRAATTKLYALRP